MAQTVTKVWSTVRAVVSMPLNDERGLMITQEQAGWFAETISKLATNVEQAVMGKRHVVELVTELRNRLPDDEQHEWRSSQNRRQAWWRDGHVRRDRHAPPIRAGTRTTGPGGSAQAH